jgi:hypothetical protein
MLSSNVQPVQCIQTTLYSEVTLNMSELHAMCSGLKTFDPYEQMLRVLSM